MASPDGYPPLPSLAAERAALAEALDGVAGVTAAFVDDATPASVLDALSAGADIFHFSGHGTADGGVVLAGADGRAEVVPADRLAEMVQAKGVRLAVLGACDTGRRDDHNVWGGVAAALVARGVPAVVAMQFTIGDRKASAFAGALYRALVAGLTVDEAVALGRTAIRTVSPPGAPRPTSGTGSSPSSTCGITAGGCSSRCRRPRPGRRRRPGPPASTSSGWGRSPPAAWSSAPSWEPGRPRGWRSTQDAERVDGRLIGVVGTGEGGVHVEQDVEVVGPGRSRRRQRRLGRGNGLRR